MFDLIRQYQRVKIKIKRLVIKSEPEIKQPKKKVELRLNYLESSLKIMIEELERALDNQENSALKKAGMDLLDSGKFLLDQKLIQKSRIKLKSMGLTLLGYTDFALILNTEIQTIIEQISCLLATMKEGEV